MKKGKEKKIEYHIHRLGDGKYFVRWQDPKKTKDGLILINEMVITDRMEIKRLEQMRNPYKNNEWPYVVLNYNPTETPLKKPRGSK